MNEIILSRFEIEDEITLRETELDNAVLEFISVVFGEVPTDNIENIKDTMINMLHTEFPTLHIYRPMVICSRDKEIFTMYPYAEYEIEG